MVTSVCDQIRRVFYLTVSVVLARQGLQLSLLSMSEECGLAKSGAFMNILKKAASHVGIIYSSDKIQRSESSWYGGVYAVLLEF